MEFENNLKALKKQIESGDIKVEEFQITYHKLQDTWLKLGVLLEAARQKSEGENEEKIKNLHQKVVGWNTVVLLDKIKQAGYALRKNAELKKAFDQRGYRILDLVRWGKQDEVFYSILRIFAATQETVPPSLLEAFKPIYSDEMFKVFIFSFLGSVLGKGNDENQKKE